MTITAPVPHIVLPPPVREDRPLSEAALVSQLTKRIRAQWPLRGLGFEVKSHGRARTDVCVVVRDIHGSSPDVLIGIEAKLASWQRALRQAVLNRFCVDLSMIALPTSRVTEAVVAACWDEGIGVLAVDQKWLHVVIAATPAKPDAALRQKSLEQLAWIRARGAQPVTTLIRGV